MKPLLSVIICAHNPRANYLTETLTALKAQTLPREDWELLLVDNASDNALSCLVDLSWHPRARTVREDELGLTPARLRGIRESSGDLLVFVDDDNVLDCNYLETATRIHTEWPMIGVWGGQILPRFERVPADWTKPYLGLLAIREFKGDKWANIPQAGVDPCGAGMCVRRSVAEAYAAKTRACSLRGGLDRRGTSLVSGGDTDIAWTACDVGLGMGVFERLRLVHLIPDNRLTEDYIVRMQEGQAYSGVILDYIRSGNVPRMSYLKSAIRSVLQWRFGRRSRRVWMASQVGRFRAAKELSKSRTRDRE